MPSFMLNGNAEQTFSSTCHAWLLAGGDMVLEAAVGSGFASMEAQLLGTAVAAPFSWISRSVNSHAMHDLLLWQQYSEHLHLCKLCLASRAHGLSSHSQVRQCKPRSPFAWSWQVPYLICSVCASSNGHATPNLMLSMAVPNASSASYAMPGCWKEDLV